MPCPAMQTSLFLPAFLAVCSGLVILPVQEKEMTAKGVSGEIENIKWFAKEVNSVDAVMDSIPDLFSKPTNAMCCKCKTCERTGRACGKSCCTKGSGGCSCESCSSDDRTENLDKEAYTDVVSFLEMSSNPRITMCCKCKKCDRTGRACGRTCCMKGSGGCSCKSCTSDDWTEIIDKEDYTNVVSFEIASNPRITMCCKCKKCEKTGRACGKTCCMKGSGGCSCKSCTSDDTTDWESSSVDLISSTYSTATIDRSVTFQLCCTCRYCQAYSWVCGRRCCAKGSGGCHCFSCSSNTPTFKARQIEI